MKKLNKILLALFVVIALTSFSYAGGIRVDSKYNPSVPGDIGGTTPAAGSFTTLGASGLISADGGQIAFPSTANPSGDPYTIDDYRERTWTPVYYGAAGSIGATAGTFTGTYTKIGNEVILSGLITLTNNGDWTGVARIGGLPYTPAGFDVGSVTLSNVTFDGYACIQSHTGDFLYFIISKSAAAAAALDASGISDTGEIRFTITYHI